MSFGHLVMSPESPSQPGSCQRGLPSLTARVDIQQIFNATRLAQKALPMLRSTFRKHFPLQFISCMRTLIFLSRGRDVSLGKYVQDQSPSRLPGSALERVRALTKCNVESCIIIP